jgi:hypothetical protein
MGGARWCIGGVRGGVIWCVGGVWVEAYYSREACIYKGMA